MWMYFLHIRVEMSQRALHTQSWSLHLGTFHERAAVIHLQVLTLRHPGMTCILGAQSLCCPSDLDAGTRSNEHFVSSLTASSIKPKDRTPLGHAKLDMGTPWVRVEASRGRMDAEAALLLLWPLVGPQWISSFSLANRQKGDNHWGRDDY